MAEILRKGTLLERKVMGEAVLGPAPALTPAPTPPPTPGALPYKEFITRHEKIRKIIDEAAGRGECVTLDSIAKAVGLDRESVEYHWKILRGDDYARETDRERDFRICSRDALERLYQSLSEIMKKE